MRKSFFLAALLGLTTVSSKTFAQNTTPRSPAASSPADISGLTAKVFDPSRFQEKDGAIPVLSKSDSVDAYFAIKALLTARDAGLDIRPAALKWVKWLLPRQKADGRFERYARGKVGTDKLATPWVVSDIADADDALLALWIELLYALSPDAGLPDEWKMSVWLAGDHLATLRDERGIYLISRENRVGLLMDNIEVYGAFKSIARERLRMGQLDNALQTAKRADNLAAVIGRVFWNDQQYRFNVSTQDIPGDEFYPHAVAQLYPPLADLPTPGATDKVVLNKWLKKYGNDWLLMKRDDFPWGLVAMLALKLGENDTAHAWQKQNRAHRFTGRWTILDEAVYQSLEVRLPGTSSGSAKGLRWMPST